MTYGEFKNRVLQLIFSYSVAGDTIALTYNNQEDYVKMIPGLLSTAQSYVYQIKKIETSIKLEDLDKEELEDGMMLYHLPDDCLRVRPGLIIPRGKRHNDYWYRQGGVFERFNDYKLFGGNKLMAPAGLPSSTILEYEKRGLPVPPNVQDNYVLKNTDEVNEILPFYVAAFCVMHDDAFKYAALYNEFETRLQRLEMNPTYVEVNETVDMYGGFSRGPWW